MLKYSKYLLLNIVRKKAIWLLLILTIGASILVNFLQIHEYTKRDFKFVTSINSFTKMIPFIFGTAFMSMIIVYVFKEGETDGTELMIASKPISRKNIISGKFMVVFIAIFAFTAFNFFLYFGIAQYDTLSSGVKRANFALSISIGGAIILIIISMILMLISSYIGMMGTVALGIVAAAVFPIASNVIAEVSRGTVKDNMSFNTNAKIFDMESIDKVIKKQEEKYLADPKNYEFSLSDLVEVKSRSYQPVTLNGSKEFNKYQSEVWYQHVVYGDFWYQWNKFYDIFTGDNPFMGHGPRKMVLQHDVAVKLSDEEVLVTATDGTKGTVIINASSANISKPKHLAEMFVDIMSGQYKTPIYSNFDAVSNGAWIDSQDPTRIKDGLIGWDEAAESYTMVNNEKRTLTKRFGKFPVIKTFLDPKFSFEARIRGMIAIVKKWEVVSWIDKATLPSLLLYKMVKAALQGDVGTFAKNIGLSDEDVKLVEGAKALFDANNPGKKYEEPNSIRGYSNKTHIADFLVNPPLESKTRLPLTMKKVLQNQRDIFTFAIVVDGEKGSAIVNKPFMEKNNIIYIWIAIGVLLSGLTVWRYSKRDFK